MADRNLSTTLEERNEDGPYWRLKIDRSASGQPGLFFTIQTETFSEHDRHIESLNQEMTFVAKDAWAALAAPLAWLINNEFIEEVVRHEADSVGPGYDNMSPGERMAGLTIATNVLEAMVAVAQKRVVS